MRHQLDRRVTLALATARVKIFEMDGDGRVTAVSEPSIGLLQDAPLPVVLSSLSIVEDRPFVAERVRTAIADQNPVEFDMRVMRRDGVLHWYRITLSPKDRVDPNMMLGVAVDISKIKEREEGNFWLTQELMHGSRNLLAILQAVTTHSSRDPAKDAGSSGEFRRRFIERLHAISVVHDLLFKSGYARVDLAELVASMTVGDQVGDRITASGAPTDINPGAAQAFGMALHELFRNACLHGALRNPSGLVEVSWTLSGARPEENLEFTWSERGAAPSAPPGPAGFGTFLIGTNLPRSLNGDVAMNYGDDGFTCSMKFPFGRLSAYVDHERQSYH